MSDAAGVFPSPVAEQMWRERYCETCCQPAAAERRLLGRGPGCAIAAQALSEEVPVEWRRGRGHTGRAEDLFRCTKYLDRPPSTRRKTVPTSTEPMFDSPREDRRLVPVEGWPDYRAIARNAASPPGPA